MEWIEISSLKLKNKGRITIIISTERMDEVIVSLKNVVWVKLLFFQFGLFVEINQLELLFLDVKE